MKLSKKLSILAAGAVAISMLLGTSTASAEVIFGDPSHPNTATEITGLQVGGNTYNVLFKLQKFAFEIYGSFPGNFPIFNTYEEGEAALIAVSAALQAAGATAVGEDGLPDVEAQAYNIGYVSFILPLGEVESIRAWRAAAESGSTWTNSPEPNELTYNLDERAWADFSVGVPVEASSWSAIKSLYR